VHCGQTVGRIKMKLGMHLGLGPGHIVLDGDPAWSMRSNGCMDQDVTWHGARPRPRRLCVRWGPRSPLPKGGGVRSPQIFGPCLLWPHGLMDEAVTWHGGRPQPRRLCVRWGPSPPPQKGAEPSSPIFGPYLLSSNGWMHQDATWYGCRPQPRGLCVIWRLSSLKLIANDR